MTITFRGATGCVGSSDTASPYSSRNYGSSITGQSAGDLLFALWGGKPYSTSPSSPTNATYTTLARRESGTTAEGDSTGSVAAQIFYKTSAGASEPNSPISDYSAPYNPAVRAVAGFYKSVAGSWTVESCVGSTESDPISVTGSSQLNFATGDVIAVLVTLNNNSDLSSPSLSVSGCTLANLTQRLPSTTAASGDDGGMCLYTADVTAGSATAAPSFSATSSPSNTAASIIFVRIAEPTVKTNGAAAFSSQSSLTANGTNKVNAAISLSGQSSFAAAGRRRLSGQVGFLSQSSLAASGKRRATGSVYLSSQSSLAASGTRKMFGAAVFSSEGAITTNGKKTIKGYCTLVGQSTVSANGTRGLSGSASLSGQATLTSNDTRTTFGSVTSSGQSSFVANGRIKTLVSVYLSAEGTMTVTSSSNVVNIGIFGIPMF